MASPFPGMDPYLEDPDLWPGIQIHMTVRLSAYLNRTLPRRYVARLDERYWIDDDENRESLIQVLDRDAERQPVTVIQVVTPRNKTPGHHARRLYVSDQCATLKKRLNLLEIDLLRDGTHTVSVPANCVVGLRSHYLVCLTRGRAPARKEVWPIRLQDRLPCIPVPLHGSDSDVVIQLQPIFDQIYAEGAYDRCIDYRGAPVGKLTTAETLWVNDVLRGRGLRP